MHSNNGRKDNNDRAQGSSTGSSGWKPSSRLEEYSGPHKDIREAYKKKYPQDQVKSNTQVSNTNAGNSKSNSR